MQQLGTKLSRPSLYPILSYPSRQRDQIRDDRPSWSFGAAALHAGRFRRPSFHAIVSSHLHSLHRTYHPSPRVGSGPAEEAGSEKRAGHDSASRIASSTRRFRSYVSAGPFLTSLSIYACLPTPGRGHARLRYAAAIDALQLQR
jgi:hypothetical protein